METTVETLIGTVAGTVALFTFLAVAYQKLTEAFVKKLKGKLKEVIDPTYICFLLSFSTCLFWNIGILSMFKETPLLFDAIVTGGIMTFEAGILNDIAGSIQAKKVQLQNGNAK